MTRVVRRATVDGGALDVVLSPRDGLVAERAIGEGVFEAVGGPVSNYRRVVAVENLPDGRTLVTQTVSYRLRIPLFGLLLASGYRHWLGRIGPVPATVWWAPPARLGINEWSVLTRLAGLTIVTGYLSTLLTQTMTFSAQEFGADKAAQGVALAVVRGDILLALPLVYLADRAGRRTVAVWAAMIGAALTALGALSPSLPWLAASQLVARGFITGVTISVAVLAAESMPAGSRAWCLGVLAMTSASGVGICVLLLPIAGTATAAWRALYALGVLGVPVVMVLRGGLPESRRFLTAGAPRAAKESRSRVSRVRLRRRLALLASGAFLFNIFSVPASQFQNEYLRKERHFSASHISLFIVVTVLPGALGILFGGRIADTRGRRVVGAVSLLGGVGAAVLFYLSRGWVMWVVATLAAVVGTAVIPALTVYGPELFPTSVRGIANGVITGAGRVGSVVGLVAVGVLASSGRLGHFGPAFALMAAGPLGLAVLVLLAFPETAGRELEELNPEDQTPARAFPGAG